MANRRDIENFILDAADQMGHFRDIKPSHIQAPLMQQFVDAGFSLLAYYQNSSDTQVDDNVVGAFVDCAMVMHQMSENPSYSPDERKSANEMTVGLEDLVNAITRAVEKNIADNR